MSETTGAVLSEPLRKSAFIEIAQIRGELVSGSPDATFSEAATRLAGARAAERVRSAGPARPRGDRPTDAESERPAARIQDRGAVARRLHA